MSVVEERTKRTKWFLEARFGMFIHWGLYSIPSRGEWVRSTERLSIEEYQQYFNEFDPVDYNPKQWARAAKEAGMQYAVLTSKHHDGFCLFDSKLTDYTAVHTKAGRDLVREYVDAFRAEGIKVGLYYSLIDWHHRDYPKYGDKMHPMRDNEAYKNETVNFDNYLEYMHGQVRELCTNYGKLDIMWFDFSYDDMTCEKWKATELIQMVRSLQPDIVIDNRLDSGGDSCGGIKSKNPTVYSGDFASPEQMVPAQGVTDNEGNSIPWEACITMNNNWGYCSSDKLFKSPKQIIRKLVECVSKNGNLLLNVGPDIKGNIPEESLKILGQIGHWMKKNGKSIYMCGISGFPKPDWGYYTRNGNLLYAHIFEGPIGALDVLPGMNGKIKRIRLVSDGTELKPLKPWNAYEYPNDVFINFGPVEWFTYPLTDEIDTVVEIELV